VPASLPDVTRATAALLASTIAVLLSALGVQACSGGGKPAIPGASSISYELPGSLDATVTEAGASTSPDATAADAGVQAGDATMIGPRPIVPLTDAALPPRGAFCSLPGSVISTAAGLVIIPGGDASTPDISWLSVPVGFCAHHFGRVYHTRQLRFAPDGDLFVASPSTSTPGGTAHGGLGQVLVLPDDDHDGIADSPITFFPNPAVGQPSVTSTQGLMFHGDYFYYEDVDTSPTNATTFYIRRVPFRPGDRQPSAMVEKVTTISQSIVPQALEHWAKMIDFAQDGTMYVTNGSGQGQQCFSSASANYEPVFGAIFKVLADGSIQEVAKGFRNPIALRCEADHDVCLAVELALDGSGGQSGREKLVPVRQGDDWGFPCCATHNVPYSGVVYEDSRGTPDCSGVTPDTVSFAIGDTPFGIDFETGKWPAPWRGRAFVALHGVVGSWTGARIVAVGLDPATGGLLPASDVFPDAGTPNAMLDFATGWDDHHQDHGRPTAIAFAPDGRLFLGDDWEGAIVWMAPVGLMAP
jgi:glucose/arabinose dehydrogenase